MLTLFLDQFISVIFSSLLIIYLYYEEYEKNGHEKSLYPILLVMNFDCLIKAKLYPSDIDLTSTIKKPRSHHGSLITPALSSNFKIVLIEEMVTIFSHIFS